MGSLKLMPVLFLSQLYMFLFAVHPAKAGFGDFAVVFSRLSTHHAPAVPSSRPIDDGKILLHVARYQVLKNAILFLSASYLLLNLL